MICTENAYEALAARDPRFDGVFFVGVTSTGIYCRPICPARTPKRGNCRFFETAAAAGAAGFRACLRCRPELAPGAAPADDAHRIARLMPHRIDQGIRAGNLSLKTVADGFDISPRQLRRIVRRQFGISLIAYVQSCRLTIARQLLTDTDLPVTEIVFASGFSSVRRFNEAFRARYGMPPTRLRCASNGGV